MPENRSSSNLSGTADAARYYRAFADFVLAYSALDAALAALDPDTRRADLRAWQIEYQTLPPETYPNTAAIAHLLPALDDSGNFAAAVDLMIEAIKARAPAGPAAGNPPRLPADRLRDGKPC